MRLARIFGGSAGLLALALLAGCGGGGGGTDGGGTSVTPPPAPPPPSPPPPPPPPPPSPVVARPASEWTPFVADLFEKLFVLDPPYAVQQGRHEYDGRLPDWSTSGLQQLGSFWHWVADQANAGQVEPTVWGDAMAVLIEAVKDDRPGDGMVAAVGRIGAVLALILPPKPDNPNELPDRVIEL